MYYPQYPSTPPSSLSVEVSRSPSMAIPACSHQLMVDDYPCILYVYSHIPYISLISMYWDIMFIYWVIYPSTGHSIASYRDPPMGRYTQLLSGCRWVCLPIS